MMRPCECQTDRVIPSTTEFCGRHNDSMCGSNAEVFCVTCNRYLCRTHEVTHESHLVLVIDARGDIGT